MMNKRPRVFACLLCVPLAQAAFGACKIAQVAELPVSVASNRPRLQGQINGQPVDILIDTGAASFIWEGAAKQLGLKMGGVQNLRMFGVGGEAIVHETVVNRLQIGAFTAKNLQMVVIYQNAPPRRGAPFFWHIASWSSSRSANFCSPTTAALFSKLSNPSRERKVKSTTSTDGAANADNCLRDIVRLNYGGRSICDYIQ
jgi:hypothetical protein